MFGSEFFSDTEGDGPPNTEEAESSNRRQDIFVDQFYHIRRLFNFYDRYFYHGEAGEGIASRVNRATSTTEPIY